MASVACQTVLEAGPEQPAVRPPANPEEAGPSAAKGPDSSQALTADQERLAQPDAQKQAAPDQQLGACTDAEVQAGHLPWSRDEVQGVLKNFGMQTDSSEQQQHPGSMEARSLPDLGLRIRTSQGSPHSSTALRLEAAHQAAAAGFAPHSHQRNSGSQTDALATVCMPEAANTLHCSTQGSAEEVPGACSTGQSADAATPQHLQHRGSGCSSHAALLPGAAERPIAKQGLDPAVVQHWIAAVQTPSQDALALSHMADAAAAAARAAADAAGSVAGSQDGAASPRWAYSSSSLLFIALHQCAVPLQSAVQGAPLLSLSPQGSLNHLQQLSEGCHSRQLQIQLTPGVLMRRLTALQGSFGQSG